MKRSFGRLLAASVAALVLANFAMAPYAGRIPPDSARLRCTDEGIEQTRNLMDALALAPTVRNECPLACRVVDARPLLHL